MRTQKSQLIVAIVLGAFAHCTRPAAVLADPPPGDLLIYYAFPSSINGVSTIADAAAEFSQYDIAIIGDGLQDGPGDPNPHPDHQNTIDIMAHPSAASTLFFGYIDLGVITNNHTVTEIQRRVDAWQAMGIDAIFFDDFGYDFGVTRARQNAAVDYVHSKGLPVCANGWNPDDLFSSQVQPTYNPTGAPTSLGADDYYLSESHQIKEGAYDDEASWQSKASDLLVYRDQLGFKLLSITTADPSNTYDQNKCHYAWYSAAIYDHTATGWGEFEFSAATGSAPFRARPAQPVGTIFKAGIAKNGSTYTRRTERGTIYVDAATPTAGFTQAADGDGDGVADDYDACPQTPPGIQVMPSGIPIGDLNCDCTVDLRDFAIIQINYTG